MSVVGPGSVVIAGQIGVGVGVLGGAAGDEAVATAGVVEVGVIAGTAIEVTGEQRCRRGSD